MSVDWYTKTILGIIAIALLAIALRPQVREAWAENSVTRCTGEMKANAWGGTEASIGGYEIEVTCR